MFAELAQARAQARHYLEMGRYREAARIYQDLLPANVHDADLHYLLAYCFLRLKEHRTALEFCQSALAYGHPDDPRVHRLIALICTREGDYPKAERHFLQALAADPQDTTAMAGYGVLLLKAGHEKKAAKLMAEAMRLAPDDEEVLYLHYLYHQAKGNRPDETGMLERLMASGTEENVKLLSAARTAIFRGDYREARENLRQAFLLDPRNQELLEALREMERESHILLWPMRVIERVGGPGVVWLAAMAAIGAAYVLGSVTAATAVLVVYLTLVIYSWTVPALVRFLFRAR